MVYNDIENIWLKNIDPFIVVDAILQLGQKQIIKSERSCWENRCGGIVYHKQSLPAVTSVEHLQNTKK